MAAVKPSAAPPPPKTALSVEWLKSFPRLAEKDVKTYLEPELKQLEAAGYNTVEEIAGLSRLELEATKIKTATLNAIKPISDAGTFDSEELAKKLATAQAPALRSLQQLLLQLNHATRSQGTLLRGHLFAMLDAEWRASVSESNRPEMSDRDFKAGVIEYSGHSLCMVSGRGPATGSHIFPAAGNTNLLVLLGLDPEDVNSPQNGLMLAPGIEKAFDRRQVSFFLDQASTIRLRVLDSRIADIDFWKYKGKQKAVAARPGQQAKPESFGEKAANAEDSFAYLEGKELQFRPETAPYRRLLAAHAELAKNKAKVQHWQPIDQEAVDVGINQLSAFRRLSPIPGEEEDAELTKLAAGLGITVGDESKDDAQP